LYRKKKQLPRRWSPGGGFYGIEIPEKSGFEEKKRRSPLCSPQRREKKDSRRILCYKKGGKQQGKLSSSQGRATNQGKV